MSSTMQTVSSLTFTKHYRALATVCLYEANVNFVDLVDQTMTNVLLSYHMPRQYTFSIPFSLLCPRFNTAGNLLRDKLSSV